MNLKGRNFLKTHGLHTGRDLISDRSFSRIKKKEKKREFWS